MQEQGRPVISDNMGFPYRASCTPASTRETLKALCPCMHRASLPYNRLQTIKASSMLHKNRNPHFCNPLVCGQESACLGEVAKRHERLVIGKCHACGQNRPVQALPVLALPANIGAPRSRLRCLCHAAPACAHGQTPFRTPFQNPRTNSLLRYS